MLNFLREKYSSIHESFTVFMGKHVYMKIGGRKLSFCPFLKKKKVLVYKDLKWLLCAGQPDFLLMDKPCQYVTTQQWKWHLKLKRATVEMY